MPRAEGVGGGNLPHSTGSNKPDQGSADFMIFSVPVFAFFFDVFLHNFGLHFGTLFASICMLPRTLFLTFSFLFRKGCPLGSLSPFWLHFGRLSAPIWLPFGVPLLPFGFLLVAFGTPALRLAPPALHLGYLWLPLFPFCHFRP